MQLQNNKAKILLDSDSNTHIFKIGHTPTCLPLEVNIIMTFKTNEKRSKCVMYTAVTPSRKRMMEVLACTTFADHQN